jgi:ABC-type uncharacterized transport system ATPase subunit
MPGTGGPRCRAATAMAADIRPIVLSLRGVTKRFGPLVANEGVDLDVRAGEIVALLGENGAGKTTLMNILFGHYVADEGSVWLADAAGALEPLPPGSPHAALEAGIGMVHQHFTLAENLTGFENIVLGTQPLLAPGLNRTEARRRVEALMRDCGLEVALDSRVSQLSVGEKQRVEILKALYRNARVLVLDEPTAVLTPQESESLFATVRALAARGLAVIFISHKLAEVLALCERVVVLRLGRKVADRPSAGADRGTLAELMVGRAVAPPTLAPRAAGHPVLELVRVSTGAAQSRDALYDADLVLRESEIVGIAGVSGTGQSALAALVAGLAVPSSGTLRVLGDAVVAVDPRRMVGRGVGRIPEDRHREGAVGAMTVADNLVLEHVQEAPNQRFGFLIPTVIREHAAAAIEAYDVRCPGPSAPIRLLSGGNMQKVILARALERAPRLILAHQPTRGLDVAATSEVHRRLIAARDRGAGVLLISEDLDELFALSDRIAAIHRGRITPVALAASLTMQAVGLMMAGHDAGAAA